MRKFLLVLLVVSLFAGVAKAMDSLDATVPANKSLISTFAGYERETRAKVNEIIENIPDIANWEVVTVAHIAVAGEKLLVNTSAAACTITLPATPEAGSFIYLADAKGTWPTYNVTLARNGNMIAGAAADYTLATSGIYFLMYVDAGYGWAVASAGGSSSELSGSLRALSGFGYTDFADVIADIGSDPVLLLIDEDMTLSTSASIPATLRLLNTHGNLITLGAGKTLTFVDPSQILSGYQQIFTGTGTVTFTKPGVVHPDWWQQNTQGTTDMTTAINKAMIAGGTGSTVQFSSGTYLLDTISKCEDLPACAQDAYLENYFVNLLDDRTIKGVGWGTIIKVADNIFNQTDDDTSNGHVFQGFDIENVVIRDMQIDMNGYNNLSPSGKTRNSIAVRLDDGGKNVLIENLFILNNPGHNNIVANKTESATQADGLTVTDCYMYGGGTGVLGNTNNVDFSFVYSEWAYTKVNNNHLEQPASTYTWSGGIELHGSYSEASNNLVIFCDPAVWICSCNSTDDGDPDIDNILVDGNVFRDCARGVAYWPCGRIRDTTISNNSMRLKWRGGTSLDVWGVHMIARGSSYPWTDAYAAGDVMVNTNIVGNTFAGEDNATRYTFFGGSGVYATSVRGLSIRNNTFYNLPGDGMVVVGSPYGLYDIVVQGNTFRNWGRGISGAGTAGVHVDISDGPAISWDTDVTIPDAGAFVLRNMLITKNYFEKDDNSTDENGTVVSAYPIVIAADTATTADQVYNVVIRDNVDWLCGDTTTNILGGNLGYVNGAPWGVFYSPNRDWIAIKDPDNATYTPDGELPGGSIAWNRHYLGSAAGVAAGHPLGWINTGDASSGNYEPFGVIGAWKIGAYADRPAAVTTDVALVYVCSDCTRCGKSGSSNPNLIWFVHKIGESTVNKWYCDNMTNGIIEAGIEE